MEIPLNLTDEHASETLAQFLAIGQTPFRFTHLHGEAASAIDPFAAVCVRVQQTDRVVAKCDKGPVIHGATLELGAVLSTRRERAYWIL